MTLPRFDVLVPETVEQACSLLAEHGGGARVLAGGTDLLVDLKRPIVQERLIEAGGGDPGRFTTLGDGEPGAIDPWGSGDPPPDVLISLHKLAGLKRIEVLDDGRLRVGALATAREIQRVPEIRDRWTALAEGADSLGSPLVRARGTIGGNICNARPAADITVPAICLGAQLELQSPDGSRTLPGEQFILAPGVTVIEPAEILTAVTFPALSARTGSAYYKLGQRKALEISVVGVAVYVELAGDDTVQAACVTLGAVGPTPLAARSAAEVLAGGKPTGELLAQAARAAAADATPIDDHRGTAEYRRLMVEMLTRRTLELAVERAGGRS